MKKTSKTEKGLNRKIKKTSRFTFFVKNITQITAIYKKKLSKMHVHFKKQNSGQNFTSKNFKN